MISMRVFTIFVIIWTLACTVCADEHANYDLGIAAYERGHYQAALYDFETRAVKGDMVAQFCLGYMYKHGKGVAEDDKKALEWYEQAAAQDYPPAQNDLGVMFVRIYESAEKNPKTLETAVRYFEKAANQKNLPAQHNLGVIGYKRLKWWTQAASQGYAPSQLKLGTLYYHGDSVERNYTETVKWFGKAANQKEYPHPIAQYSLGFCYEMGQGLKKDLEAAFRYYEKAATQGHVGGQFKLGLFYMNGWGIDKDLKEAEKWYKMAAKQGGLNAQNNLASMYVSEFAKKMYREDKDRRKSYLEKAYRWYFLAAQQGETVAQTNIATAFENGRDGLPQDFAEAYYWYSLALKNKDDLKDAIDKDLVSETIEASEKVGNQLDKVKKSKIQELIDNWKSRILDSSGTGFYIDKNHILTNAHVVTWEDHEGKSHEYDEYRIPYRRVELVAWEPELDLALLYDRSENTDNTTAIFRSQHVKMAEKIVIFGYPQSDKLSYEGNFTDGIVSGRSNMINVVQPDNRFQHTAPTQRGNSGGPRI